MYLMKRGMIGGKYVVVQLGLSHLKAPAGQDKARTGVYKHLFIL